MNARNRFMKPFTKSIFHKLILINAIITTLTISISGFIIISNLSRTLQDNEIKLEGEALKKLQSFTETEYNNLYKAVIQMNYPGGLGEIFAKAASNQDKLYTKDDDIRKIKDFLRTACSYDDNITDFIVISNDGSMFYDTSLPNQQRAAIASYPFLQDKLVRDAIDNKKFITVGRDNPSRYIHKGSNDVVTFIGNIYDPTYIERKQTVGAYIINISLDKFKQSYTEYESSVKGDFVISNAKGEVIYSSDKNFNLLSPSHSSSMITLSTDKSDEAILQGKSYIYHESEIGSTTLSVANFIPKDLLWEYEKASIRKASLVLLISLLATVLIMSLYFYMFSKRVGLLLKNMEKVKQGNFTARMHVKSDDEIGQLGSAFNDMCEQLDQYIQRVYTAEIEAKNAELNALQAQINPHFLFNTLESIRMRALQDQKPHIAQMVSVLGNLFRWSVKTKGTIVEVEQEIYYMTSYLELQLMRFNDQFEFELDIEDRILPMGIPKLLLQPLVENAIVHGKETIEGRLMVMIQGVLKGKNIRFMISDNGRGMDETTLQNVNNQLTGTLHEEERTTRRIGLSNVNNRIQLMFGKEYGLQIESREEYGTTVTITLPAMSVKEMQEYVQIADR